MPFLSWRPLSLLAYDADSGEQIAPSDKTPCKRVYGLERGHKGRLRLASRKGKLPVLTETKKNDDVEKSKEAAGKGKGTKQADKPDKSKNAGKQDNKQGKAKEDNKQDKSNDDGKQDKAKDNSDWTDEQDKKLLELKQKDPTMQWAKVGEEVGHTAGQCKDRMKQLKSGEAGKEAEAKTDDKKSSHSKGSKANEDHNKQKSKDAKAENKQPGKDGKKAEQTAKAASKAGSEKELRYTAAQWRAMTRDRIFSHDELVCLQDLMEKDANQNWLRIASRFHDATGRRVHPDDIRENIHQLYDSV